MELRLRRLRRLLQAPLVKLAHRLHLRVRLLLHHLHHQVRLLHLLPPRVRPLAEEATVRYVRMALSWWPKPHCPGEHEKTSYK